MIKVLVAMNAFKGSLDAKTATSLVSQGFQRGFPEATVVQRPLADGGDGTLGILVDSLGGHIEFFEATGPYGDTLTAPIGFLSHGKTAVIESALVSGLALCPKEKRNVWKAESTGIGQLMVKALERKVKRIIVGIGGTAMNDGGIGAVQAAGGLVLDEKGTQVGKGISGLCQVDRVSLGTIPEKFKGVEITGISDVFNPLLGPDGATRVYGPQKGLSGEDLEKAEACMEKYARILERDLGKDPSHVEMAGAGGGLGAALWAFFGASLEMGAEFILQETGIRDMVGQFDLVITGEGRVDTQTSRGKAPFTIASLAQREGVPTVVLGGGLSDDLLNGVPPVFSSVFSTTISPCTVEEAMEKADQVLPFVAEQIGRAARIFCMSFPEKDELSAGGVVVRKAGSHREVLMIRDRFGRFSLPKGHVDPGETNEEAALREVYEETGIRAFIVPGHPSKVMKYRFFNDRGKVSRKTVFYFLMEPDPNYPVETHPAEGEVRDAVWVPCQELDGLCTYSGLIELIKDILP